MTGQLSALAGDIDIFPWADAAAPPDLFDA